MSLQFRNSHFSIKSLDDDGSFSGYASIFDETDSYADRTMRGCFKKSLTRHRKNGRLPALLWQHRSDEPIGAYTMMKEDQKGLYVEGQLELEVQKAREAYALLKTGAVSGLSIGFNTIKATWNKVDHVRELIEVDLWEVSIVTFAALGSARVADVKNRTSTHNQLLTMKRALQLRGASLDLTRV